jgi:hypothetical protein
LCKTGNVTYILLCILYSYIICKRMQTCAHTNKQAHTRTHMHVHVHTYVRGCMMSARGTVKKYDNECEKVLYAYICIHFK